MWGQWGQAVSSSITGKPKNVALRIVRRLGREPAQKIAKAIMEVTK